MKANITLFSSAIIIVLGIVLLIIIAAQKVTKAVLYFALIVVGLNWLMIGALVFRNDMLSKHIKK